MGNVSTQFTQLQRVLAADLALIATNQRRVAVEQLASILELRLPEARIVVNEGRSHSMVEILSDDGGLVFASSDNFENTGATALAGLLTELTERS